MRAPLPHPFVRLSPRARRGALLVLAPLAFAMMFVLSSLDAGLRTPASPYGIVCFELAGDRASAGRMLEAWGSQGRRAAARSLRLDFVFLAAYAPGLALLCAAASDRAPRCARVWPRREPCWPGDSSPPAASTRSRTWRSCACSAEPRADAWPALAAACAWPKFALVGAGLAYLAGLPPRLRRREATELFLGPFGVRRTSLRL